MTIGALCEPALLVAILAMAIAARTSNLPALVRIGLTHPAVIASPARILALASFLVVILAESGRLPVDNPSTHLELTMIHEAMVLEYSGADLGLIILGESMRLVFLLGLLVNLLVPWGVADRSGALFFGVGLLALVAKVTAVGVIIAVFEVFTAKMRLFRLPELLAGGFVLALLGAVTAVVAR
jgi:formate hydrogenlyase subunit 4